MSYNVKGMFSFTDRVQIESMSQRLQRSNVLNSNIANAETPGYRALGYDFEKQLQLISDVDALGNVKVSHPKHLLNPFTHVDGDIRPDVFVRPTETIPQDGNTVDVDKEMASLAKNQILYRAAVETINKKIGVLRYAINGGR